MTFRAWSTGSKPPQPLEGPRFRIPFPPPESPCLTQTRPLQVENRGFRAGVRRSVGLAEPSPPSFTIGFTTSLGRVAAAKGPQDFVSIADREVESLIRTRLADAFPTDGFIGEESEGGAGERCWVVDPIDGTNNFLRGASRSPTRSWGSR